MLNFLIFFSLTLGSLLPLVLLIRQKFVVMYLAPILIAYTIFGIAGLAMIRTGGFNGTYFVNALESMDYVTSALVLLCISLALFLWFFLLAFKFGSLLLRPNFDIQLDRFKNKRGAALLIFYLFIAIIYLLSIHPSPLFVTIIDSPEQAYIRRIAVTRDYNGIAFISTLARSLSFVTAFYAFTRILSGGTEAFKLKMWGLILFSTFVVASNGEKAPPVILFLGLGFTKLLFMQRIKIKHYVNILAFPLLIIFLSYTIFSFSDSSSFFHTINYRIFVGQSISIPLSIQYHEAIEFTGLSTVSSGALRFLFQLQDHQPPLSQYIMFKYFPEMTQAGAFNVNGLFVGDAYGWGGNSAVILGSVIYGVYNGLFLSVINIFKKNYWTFAFFIYVATHFTGVMTSFNLVLFSTHMILTGIVVFLFAGPFRFSVKRLNDGY